MYVNNLPKVRCYLCQSHLGDDGEHYLLALGRVRVFDVLVQPRLQEQMDVYKLPKVR